MSCCKLFTSAEKDLGCATRIHQVCFEDLVQAFESKDLVLPSIQRSLVWRNEKIVDYWDSLMRGYPAGLMMVTEGDNGTCELLDGQQRLQAILLGFGKGGWAGERCLWVDIGRDVGAGRDRGDRIVELRVNSTGQPWGYDAAWPNEKFRSHERAAHVKDAEKQGQEDQLALNGRDQVALNIHPNEDRAARMRTGQLLQGKYIVSLESILVRIRDDYDSACADYAKEAGVSEDVIAKRLKPLRTALDARVIVQVVNAEADDLVRLFQRIGQGGAALTEDEFAYSLIKDALKTDIPQLREMVSTINEDGRLASDTALVLAVARTAAVTAGSRDNRLRWRRVSRAAPATVRDNAGVTAQMAVYFGRTLEASPLREQLRLMREMLEFSPANPCGLPRLLFTRLPRNLIDVLVYLAVQQGAGIRAARPVLVRFVLWWLVFVWNDDKAGQVVFGAIDDDIAVGRTWSFDAGWVAGLVKAITDAGHARAIPRQNQIDDCIKHEQGWPFVRETERYKVIETNSTPDPAASLRSIIGDRRLASSVLMWLQRRYLTDEVQGYDPTSLHDEDLPYDLDHLVPGSLFWFHWRTLEGLKGCDPKQEKLFREQRHLVGNSLGNFRWLESGRNRSRQNKTLSATLAHATASFDDFVESPKCWDVLINEVGSDASGWTKDRAGRFRRLVEERGLRLLCQFITESGIAGIMEGVSGEG